MARPNYGWDKRQREQKKRRKKEEKRLRRAQKSEDAGREDEGIASTEAPDSPPDETESGSEVAEQPGSEEKRDDQ